MKKRRIIAVCFMLSWGHLFSAVSENDAGLLERVQKLETELKETEKVRKSILDELSQLRKEMDVATAVKDVVKENYTVIKDALKDNYEQDVACLEKTLSNRVDVHAEVLKLQNDKENIQLETIKWIITVLSGAGVFGWLIARFRYIDAKIKKTTEEKIEKDLDVKINHNLTEMLDGKSKTIKEVFALYDYETRLKKSKKILIAHNGSSDALKDAAFCQKLLQEFKTDIDVINKDTKQTKKQYEDYDLVLLINEGFQVVKDNNYTNYDVDVFIKAILDSSPYIICLSYKGQFGRELDTTRLSSANMTSQLYGNLINALKHQDLIKKGVI